MKQKILTVTLSLMLLALGLAPITTTAQGIEHDHEHAQVHMQKLCYTQSMVKLKEDLRKLWIDHVVWTRLYIVSAIPGAEDQQKVLERLLRNQQDIGDTLKPYYGVAKGDKLAELLREHIVLAGKVVDAAKSGNQADFDKYNKDWHRNADDLAKFLSSINPNWTFKQIQDIFYVHLQLIIDDVSARLKKDWDAETIAFDKGREHMIRLADIMTAGIIKQFPSKFK